MHEVDNKMSSEKTRVISAVLAVYTTVLDSNKLVGWLSILVGLIPFFITSDHLHAWFIMLWLVLLPGYMLFKQPRLSEAEGRRTERNLRKIKENIQKECIVFVQKYFVYVCIAGTVTFFLVFVQAFEKEISSNPVFLFSILYVLISQITAFYSYISKDWRFRAMFASFLCSLGAVCIAHYNTNESIQIILNGYAILFAILLLITTFAWATGQVTDQARTQLQSFLRNYPVFSNLIGGLWFLSFVYGFYSLVFMPEVNPWNWLGGFTSSLVEDVVFFTIAVVVVQLIFIENSMDFESFMKSVMAEDLSDEKKEQVKRNILKNLVRHQTSTTEIKLKQYIEADEEAGNPELVKMHYIRYAKLGSCLKKSNILAPFKMGVVLDKKIGAEYMKKSRLLTFEKKEPYKNKYEVILRKKSFVSYEKIEDNTEVDSIITELEPSQSVEFKYKLLLYDTHDSPWEVEYLNHWERSEYTIVNDSNIDMNLSIYKVDVQGNKEPYKDYAPKLLPAHSSEDSESIVRMDLNDMSIGEKFVIDWQKA